jgi:bifunctional DNA-binding transcriptional regulator/antitoxin component of YhaV-PrlF toxin-antitoxin module
MKIRISSDGRIALPAKLRRQDRIKAGQQFEVERVCSGEYRLTRIEENKGDGVVDWLLDCPVKGYFVPIEFHPTGKL